MVGSIKTVIGHTEGTAGLASILKASLAVQHGRIPANLHFNTLNPKISPFYTNLHIPTETSAWPALPEESPRRVSVNSFGFGGTNAHAIIESWDGYRRPPGTLTSGHATNGHNINGNATDGYTISDYVKPNGHSPNGKQRENKASNDTQPNGYMTTEAKTASKSQSAGPFVLSANSGTALAASAAALATHLRANPNIDLGRLAYTLFRRTDFSFRAAFSASSAEQLADKLELGIESLKSSTRTATIPEVLPPRILGVFTGQGAQWATMGKDLYETSEPFRDSIDRMQDSLNSLPMDDRPNWTLVDQLNAPAKISRVGEAAVSQPLCTALQVALVDTLRAAGIQLAAVVGHSSGEIGAAYAAGYLNATDAIRVAYYRGMHSHLARGPGGKRGKMMAVGMPLGQATAFCGDFNGAITVAASNSQTSCTLAGDAEAIDTAEARLRDNGTFARILQVDTAYHSQHMKQCGTPYLESMKRCGVKVHKRRKECTWYSSVWGPNGRGRSFDQTADALLLTGQYWVDNMTQAVLFSQAVSRALNEDQYFDIALEVGPHPALKGPTSETIKLLTGLNLPYSGILKRGQNAAESLADTLGMLWKLFPSPSRLITFDGVRRAFENSVQPQKLTILKGLPAYSWDHSNVIWKESRSARIFRAQDQARHELLGHCVTYGEGDKREVHWKQLIRLSELPWIVGHRIQGEVLFPASGYLSMAYEAAIRLVDDQQPMRLVELHDINIERAMRLEEDSSGLEVVFTVRITSQSNDCITAEVACYSGPVDTAQPLDTPPAKLTSHFTGTVRVWLGEPSKDALPRRTKPLLPMDALDMEQLYSNLAEEGFNYAELFQAKSMLRRLHRTVVAVSSPPKGSSIRPCMHPAPVDTAFQGLLAGFSFPGDGRLGCIYLPTRVECVRISMMPSDPRESFDLKADATVTSTEKTTLIGDIDLFSAADRQINVQVRGVHLTAVGQRRDPWLYASTTWVRDADYGIEPGKETKLSDQEQVLYEQLTRTAHFYLRQLRKKILKQELILMGKYRRHMMTWVLEHLLPQIDAGEHPEVRPEWKNDTLEMVQQWRNSQPADNNDMNILHAMGKNLVGIVRGTTPPLKILTQDGMLDRLYVEGLGAKDGNADLGAVVKQLAHRYPRMNVIEVGAGTGGTTRAVLDAVGTQYASYTYTDISTGFFDNARTVFRHHINKLNFKTLNIENDPIDQGFAKEAYDLVVSSNCLHATRSLDETLRHCRQLLRPGGRLVLLEITKDFLPTQLVMSTLPGWFLGVDDGRVWAPTVALERWDMLLKANGFSGVDISSTPSFCSVIVAQAVNENVRILREPFNAGSEALPPNIDFLIIGSGASAELASKTKSILETAVATSPQVTVLPRLEGIKIPQRATVLYLNDLDSPAFRDMSEERFRGLQDLMGVAESVLWVTSGAKSGKDPEANIPLGLSSTLRAERVAFRLQFLDVDEPPALDPTMLAKMLLRLALVDPSQTDNMLWTQEPELALRNGAIYIPRVLPLDHVNRRSAARIRNVTQTINLQSGDFAAVLDERQSGLELQALPFSGGEDDELRVRVTASTLRALAYNRQESQYACIGHELSSGDKVLALSSINGSLISVTKDHVLCRWRDDNRAAAEDAVWLQYFIAQALARYLLDGSKASIWVHGAPDSISKAIHVVADEQGISVFQTASRVSKSSRVKFIHPFASEEDVQNISPVNLQGFINLARTQDEALTKSIRAISPETTILTMTVEDLTIGLNLTGLASLAIKLQPGILQVSLEEDIEVTGIDQAPTLERDNSDPTAIVNWTTTDTVSALIRPLASRGLFTSGKTYLLCGMTGDLGISVCLWMVENGARNVVLTSRNPNVPQGVLDYLSRKGATVRSMAVDIVNMDSVRAAHAKIKSTMPPIGGVMNAAMVLRDRLFHHLPWEDFYATLAPKVVGSKNLDSIFGDEQLDFFICFSSTTSIVGSIGQSAYAAANHYMASLVQGRRQRGLAGSVVHIAILTGFGYIFRRDSDHAETIYKAILPRFDRQSETDLHEMLAEAVVCGRPGSGLTGELITGIRPTFQSEWRDDPRLSCYTGQQQQQEASGTQQSGSTASVRLQLASAEDPTECLEILEQGFKIAVGNMLEIDPQALDSNLPVASLGIDSLVAIRIREWFLKELGVDVPVLKVMSDTYSMSRMCDDVLVDWRRRNKA
ncbi:hypothetical protein GGR51DRAFT_540789 [Nemania sp. FL0031]|nr:hypothetical protein GGR51DRAFT_540789 [Nemania sp. FL0031]